MPQPWDNWVPGVLSRNQLQQLATDGFIRDVRPQEMDQIDHSSFDLHLTDVAYQLTEGSVKPSGQKFLHDIKKKKLATKLSPSNDGSFFLHPQTTYLFGIRESIEGLGPAFWGHATAKSSIGRLDVLVRLIVNGMRRYESFEGLGTEHTEMYVEVTPITFPVRVRKDISLNQLRIIYGDPRDCEMDGKELLNTCFANSFNAESPILSVDLSPVNICEVRACGFCASNLSDKAAPIDLWKPKNSLDPSKWFNVVSMDEHSRLKIIKNRFYILRSKEKLTIPSGIAIYARAIDEEIGEMRIHYAGFAHPNFGINRTDGKQGTPLIFEVRGHNMDVSLLDGEVLARLRFFRMSEDSPPDNDSNDVDDEDSYNDQDLKLSKIFSQWTSPPDKFEDSN